MSRVLDRLPMLATSGVGSLPFTDPLEAARHAASAYELPFCPQLPRVDGDMVSEWLGADPARCGWSVERDRQRPAAWDAWRSALAAHPPAHAIVKLQVTGPITLAAALEGTSGAVASAGLATEIAHWLAASAGEQVRSLGAAGLDVLLVVDEPGLARAGLGPRDTGVWDPLRATGPAAIGLHVCGPVPWAVIGAAEPDVISIDVARYGLDAAARATLARVVRRGGRIAWGALDPVTLDGTAFGASRCAAALASLGLPPDVVAGHSLLTPSCGSGRLAPDREREVAAALAGTARETRAAVRAIARRPARAAVPG